METNIKNYELAEQEYANSFLSIRELSTKYNIPRQTFQGWLLARGYNITNRRALKSFNVNYFDSIDTEEKAYWLGFLFADGALSQNNKSYNIELSLKISDSNHVKKFAKAINKSKVLDKVYRTRCILGSKYMFNILSNYGCTIRKSLTLKFPDINIFQDKNLIRHFIRGYFDGDGCISYGNKEHTYPIVIILGTEDFLNGIQSIYGTNQKYRNANEGQNITKELSFAGSSAIKFMHWIYEDSTIYLERKFNRYKELCRLYEESYKSLRSNIGKGCDVNTEITVETKESTAS